MDPDSVLLYLDETHIRSYHVLRSTWSEVGRQKQVPTFGHHAHVSLFGAVNIHDGETVLHQTTSANAAGFRVLASMRNLDNRGRLEAAAKEAGVTDRMEIVQLDVTDFSAVETVIQDVIHRYGQIDLLVR
ncbi:SDR family oxidoreductase [Parageobacillus thermoglucosidasius]|nr:SDR family oxidoreductase [Parageobacillus thermoglucosidasius]MED4984784.1 SDR family oxidoreductase [Parageobacillus thermoglucosidasius]